MFFGEARKAIAQTVPEQLPGAVEPGRRDEVLPLAPEAPLFDLDQMLRQLPRVEPPPGADDQLLNFVDIRLSGVSVYRPEDLQPLYAALLNQEITVADLYGIAQAIQAQYQQDGYTLSFALITPQTVEDGIFTITVVEGYIDRVIIEDMEGGLKETLARILSPITESRPLHSDDLERYLLLANDLAGISATGLLRPSSSVQGASELVIKSALIPVTGSLTIDNRGSEFAGPWRASAGGALNSFLSDGEALTAQISLARPIKELRSISAGYAQPIGSDGWRLNLSAGYSMAEPGFTLDELDVETKTLSTSIDLSYPLIRTRDETLYLNGGFATQDSDVDVLGADFSHDRLRELVAGLTYLRTDSEGGRSGINFRIIQGLPFFAASDPDRDDTSRADAQPEFTKATFQIDHARALFDRFVFTGSGKGQVASQQLLASEEFSLGGQNFGRAYNTGEITGEHGFAISLELGYDFQLPTLQPSTNVGDKYNPDFEQIRPYVYYDFGKAWDDKTISSDGLSQSLSSIGLGVRTRLAYGPSLSFEYAHPLTKIPSNQTTSRLGRLFFFFGWNY